MLFYVLFTDAFVIMYIEFGDDDGDEDNIN